MPRILRLTNRFNLGGPTYNVGILTKYLAPEYETLLVGAPHEPGEESSEYILKDLGVEYQVLPSMGREIHPFRDTVTLAEVIRLIRKFRPHIVHTHASKAGAVGRLAAQLCGVPVTVHTFHGHVFHSYFGPLKTRVFKSLERYLARLSDAIIAVSPRQKEELASLHRICPPEKIHVVPLGFELQRFLHLGPEHRFEARRRFQLPPERFIFGTIGRLAPIKNHSLLLNAFAEVAQSASPKPMLLVVGDGPLLDKLRGQAARLGLTSCYITYDGQADIFFTGWVKYIEHLLPALDVVVLSSDNEGTPVSLIEAQAAGLPVISTDVGGVRDVTLEKVSALLVPPRQQSALAQAMNKLYRNTALRLRMANTAREFVAHTFSATSLAERMRNLYEKLLNQKT
ncbi:MAG: glycosyltransferase family 4 protein [Flavobacteriales bacterium]|nr:glycosyltransferase family 4 protein [Flavobacteriales bacterium]MCX7768342.1 glycosyltransferase family 4 protein [Flavobacteriales bacterium]MDW8409098.1 glycosyltransferase family 4 protein [Flavobacteriales bacterium]